MISMGVNLVLDHKVHKVQQVQQVLMGFKELKELRGLWVLALKVPKALLDRLFKVVKE